MNLYPAIDILGGRAVRLRQGLREQMTDYGTPLEMAERWTRAGAGWLHVVDLDGAFGGTRANGEVFREIRRTLPQTRVQTGGGVRELSTITELVDLGVDRVILGTAAVEAPQLLEAALGRFPGRIAVGIDARAGTVRVNGWTRKSPLKALELAKKIEDAGVETVIYTDISRDGEFSGVNIELTRKMLEHTRLRVIASGGVASLDDIVALRDLGHPRLEGAIIGKALYEGQIDLESALAVIGAG